LAITLESWSGRAPIVSTWTSWTANSCRTSAWFPLVEALARGTSKPLEVHLMIADPDRYIGAFATAGAQALIVHQENTLHLHRTLSEINVLVGRPAWR
jgi:hypothetical protein